MEKISRRSLLLGGGSVLAGAAVLPRATAASAPVRPAGAGAGALAPVQTVLPGDSRYPQLMAGNNKRWVARPECFRIVKSSADAEQVVREAVEGGKYLTVRSGGHCFADFTSNPEVQVLMDMSAMHEVAYDPAMRAFAIQPGARLLNVYGDLFTGWGVTIPGGMCWSVGAGGHVAGGGYGFLSREHGLVVDHLYAVEVVVVDARRNVRTVVATRDPRDPNHDLWWAHTGGGGGNFGVVTRYWFRSPDAAGSRPEQQLVRPPAEVYVRALSFPWDGLSERDFSTLLRNFGEWQVESSRPDSPLRHLSTVFNVCHKAHGSLDMFAQVDASRPGAKALLDSYVKELTRGTSLSHAPMTRPSGDLGAMPGLYQAVRLPWYDAARAVGLTNPTITEPSFRGGHKSALMRVNFTDEQLSGMYRQLSDRSYWNPSTMIVLFSYGGQVNAVPPAATAAAQRSSAFKMLFQTFWTGESDDRRALDWLRETYRRFFASTHGVPVPGPAYEGCYVNYPDKDMTSPVHNRSGLPWHDFYYGRNYPRLQAVKRRWDPSDFFHHSMSVTPA